MGNKNRSRKASKRGTPSKPDLDVGQLASVLVTSGEAVTSGSSSGVDYGYDGARLNVQLMQGSTRRVLAALGVTASRDPVLLRQAMDFMKREPHFAAAEKLVEADKGRSMAKYSQAILQAFEVDLKAFVTSQQEASIERSESARRLSVLAGMKKATSGGVARRLMKGKMNSTASLMAKKEAGKRVVINKGANRGPMVGSKASSIRKSIQKRRKGKKLRWNIQYCFFLHCLPPPSSLMRAGVKDDRRRLAPEAPRAGVGGPVVEYAAFSQTGRIPVNPHKVNQDSHWAVEDRALHCSFFGVADGHGENGHKVSGLISRQLPESLMRELARTGVSTRKALERAFRKTNQTVLSADVIVTPGRVTISGHSCSTYKLIGPLKHPALCQDVTLSGSACISVFVKGSKMCRGSGLASRPSVTALPGPSESADTVPTLEIREPYLVSGLVLVIGMQFHYRMTTNLTALVTRLMNFIELRGLARTDELRRITKMGGRVEPFRIGVLGIPMGPSRVWLKNQVN
ncbi:hypothetical protein Pmar_PMAR011868 [Perkinsus marinus ATCC 50983]|uniref:PPM-type phosphatase domain-containing protein n=1 Tax=Perkinsus marinus (strain ATCC 50983 / TXsc) TaxID=423536 RepID=C5LBJ7_PERM5|nr:hypothetical protein Pmar_PMAR011868 [Perkinsus marinus ATCC 50983]EER05818.1 hypothetical protein Pmar_PMAR011868 [Perkinsus marinus ATCC 50983]|eukprot:XP_002774002.1 hypothetical protein Pmar_PMAR011868 [Perkinsus marinus ATCC 50983]